MGFHRQPPVSRPVPSVAPALLALGAALAPPGMLRADPEPCREGPCVVVEHEPSLAAEAGFVVDALSRKLAARGVTVTADPGGRYRQPGEQPVAGEGAWPGMAWVVHLRAIPPDGLLVTVADPAAEGGAGSVRELGRGADPAETARTIALIIEEAVLVRLVGAEDQAPLGAGLAIIEPPEVGGIKAPRPDPSPGYPHLRGIEIGLVGWYVTAAEDLVAGPRLRLEGAAARNLVVSVAAGWAGTATFAGAGVTGTASSVPVEAQVGAVFLPGRILELSVHGGFSVGFAVYRTSGAGEQRTDILFDPWFVLGLRAALRIHGPWAVAVDAGGALVLIRDELRSSGTAVYLQDWALPRLGLAVQLLL